MADTGVLLSPDYDEGYEHLGMREERNLDDKGRVILPAGDGHGDLSFGINYLGACFKDTSAGTVAVENHTNGFRFGADHAATVVIHGIAIFELHDSSTNTWAYSYTSGRSDAAAALSDGGSIALSGALTQITATTVGGINAYDAGTVRVRYER